ncbi:hypothetical protein C0Q70_15260 [Pomacea canaliculata]|uniref:Rab-GAP TBC domain-containing protein n=1 Tax=Pomacea canaliculata TaxID=400727 RepID=A0A2T7NUE0_POMCA|nr:hypothetical protein C0Q70_15260 [Pomacea canaliculata]
MQPEYKKFSIDPQITSFEMLQGILAKAFDIKSDFTLSYLARDTEGQEVYLSMLSDWDMDAAFQCAADPCLKLKVDLKPFDQELDDWDVIARAEIPQHRITSILDKSSLLGTITSNITSQVGRTMSTMQRAMGLKHPEETYKPLKLAMSDMEFHNYLDSAGYMVKPNEFRLSIYQGGIESSLRRVAWRHLLNIFPEQMSGRERFDYLKRKELEYYSLRDEWKERFSGGSTTEEVKYVASMVKKDVLRTDRSHRLYAGGDDNKNTLSLFHILVTYALTHPDVSYCQGMSDLASPLLVIQKDEAQAYICFCSLMQRLRGNFSPDGSSMMTQFRHLSELLKVHDPQFYEYLQGINAHDLFFCYRWLLLQLKREFPFEDALYMMEVMWSTLPPSPPEQELSLVDHDYNAKLLSSSPCSPTFSFQQSVYAKLLAMRCSSRMRDFAVSGAARTPPTLMPTNPGLNKNSSFDASPGDEDRGVDYPEIDDPMTRSLQQRSSSIDQVLHDCTSAACLQEDCIEKLSSCESGKQNDGELVNNSVCSCHKCKSPDKTRDFIVSVDNQHKSVLGHKETCSIPQLNGTTALCQDSPESAHSYADESPEILNTHSNGDSVDPETSISSDSHQTEVDQHMQFNLSLESSSAATDTADAAEQDKKEVEDGYSGFFGSMRKFLASPKRRPLDIYIPQEISSYGSASSTSPKQPASELVPLLQGLSDSGVSDGAQDGGASETRTACPAAKIHRDQIVQAHMGYEDVAMYFDKMVRRHNVQKVLHQARELYSEYLRSQQELADQGQQQQQQSKQEFGLNV